MGKRDLLVVVVAAAALGAALVRPASTPRGGPVELAELRLGMTEAEVIAVRGQPTDRSKQGELSYGGDLTVSEDAGKVSQIVSKGRWMFQEGGHALPGFMHSREKIRSQMGEPQLTSPEAWTYRRGTAQIRYDFSGDTVVAVTLSPLTQATTHGETQGRSD